MDPTYPLYPIVSFLCFLLVLSPLPWHFQAWNTGTCMYMLWTASVCLIWFINSLVWHNNAIDWAPIYCDISTRIIMGTAVAIPACSLCIQRRLYGITSTRAVTSNKQEKIKNVCIDLAICLGFPLFIMALAYISQGHRYDIYEDVGCFYAIYDVWPAFPTFYMWPLTLALISSVYCVMTLRSFARRRSQLSEFLNSGASSITAKRYMRLMMLSCTEIVFTIPLATWVLYEDIINMNKYISWADTHSDFHVVWTYPSIIWRNDKQLRVFVEFDRWNIIICAIVFCAFFTFAEESRNNYRALFGTAAKRFGMTSTATYLNGTSGFGTSKAKGISSSSGGRSTLPVLPMFQSRNKKRDSMLTSSITLEGLPMDDKFEDEKTAVPAGSLASSSSSFASRSQEDLHEARTLAAKNPTSPPPPAPPTKTPGNANMV